jgi:hypothetical protein
MDTCTVETGLLRKKPCGHPAVTHCANCEQPLCKDHAVAQLNEAKHKTGKFMCKECDSARKAFEKNLPPPAEKKAPAAPAAPAAKAPAAPKPAEPAKPADDGALEFKPEKKK